MDIALAFVRSEKPWRLRRVAARGAVCRPAFGGLVDIPQNPLPRGLTADVVRTADDIGLRMAICRPAQGPARGTVLLLQGRADFIEKYAETIGELSMRGFAVVTFDWRGQGGSQRLLADALRNHATGFDAFAQDIDVVQGEMRRRGLPGPVVALAHSMGAAVLLRAMARGAASVDRAVVTAPMVEIAPTLRPAFADTMASLACAAGLSEALIPGRVAKGSPEPVFSPGNVLTSDARRYLRSHHVLAAAPHLAVGKPTIGWVRTAFAGMAAFRQPGFAQSLGAPVLCITGAADRVTSTEAAVRLFADQPLAQTVVLPGCAHDVLMESDALRARVWRAFDGFVADL